MRQNILALGICIGSALTAGLAALASRNTLVATSQTTNSTLEEVQVGVPESMRFAPFDQKRSLNIPKGYQIQILARILKARFMAVAPNGDLLVSQPSTGSVKLIRGSSVTDFVTGLDQPHDIVFHTIGSSTFVYIAQTNQITRYLYTTGDSSGKKPEVVVKNLPDASLPELGGKYGHALKNIALDSKHKLYVSIGSSCNVCLNDTTANPVRGSIYVYDADGANGKLFARGIRNAEGLDFVPSTDELWVVVNNRDNAPYPYQKDYDGDGSSDYGKTLQSFVDNYPLEPFTKVVQGGDYGWPFCNSNAENGVDNMPYDRDMDTNKDGAKRDCTKIERVSKGIQAHSAPLGLSFLGDSSFPMPYREGAVSALHGSWNRAKKTGYKVIFFPWKNGKPGAEQDLVSGFLDGERPWGRPVDAIPDRKGGLLISDDYSGTIYKLSKQ
jgi:glucose/arabinose dehydrogenase